MTTVKSLSREMKFFLLALIPIYFISVGLIIQPFDSIVTGIYEIIREPDFLITDYIAVGGMGAAFVNAGMMALISIYFVYSPWDGDGRAYDHILLSDVWILFVRKKI